VGDFLVDPITQQTAVLQRIAAETVFSDLERWHISAITLDTESQ
jgi:hypothetical protein